MWFILLLLLLAAHHQPLKAQGENRIFLKNGKHPCEGYIGIFHNDELGYLGKDYWSDDTLKVVCSSTHCGNPVSSSMLSAPWPIDKFWLNQVTCSGNEQDLWNCTHPGWGISFSPKDCLRKIECSHKIDISMDGFTCAGAVQYSINGGETYSGYFCADNWGMDEADLLCKSLDCGTSKDIIKEPWLGWKGFKEKKSKTMTIKCSGIQNFTHLWQCASQMTPSCQNPVSVICTGHERVQLQGNPSEVCSGQLRREEKGEWKSVPFSVQNKTHLDAWCQKMHCGTSKDYRNDGDGTGLTCSDNVKVVLKDNDKPSRCYGEVYVEVNNSSQPVCSTWSEQAAQVVCSELKCGTVFSKSTRPNKQGIMDNVQCSGKESSLWHCRAKRDHQPFPCTKSTTAYVVCTDSFEVRLMDGPGKCAGRVEIEHEGRSLRVHEEGWTDTNSEIVCGLLGCGNKGNSINPDKFSQGSGEFLPKAVQCKKNAKHISECITGSRGNAPKKAMGITCQEHKVVFLKGKSCSGSVGIAQGNQTYWLSGSNSTWNQNSANTVCRQMHCGKALNYSFTSPDDMTKPFWSESYLCSPDKESLFDCKGQPSYHADTIATVMCSGNITVDLTNECWGKVNVCLDGNCGGVCADTWTEQKSAMLCKNLGCGNSVPQATAKPKESKVIFKSMHSTNETTHLSQCNFVRSDENDNTCNQNPAYVVCSGSIKTKLSSSRDKCSGNVEVQYGGNLLPVCRDALKEKVTQNTICAELKCGHAIKTIDYFGPKASKGHAISQIQCSANDKSLAACSIDLKEVLCIRGGLQCSGWSKMALTVNKSCSGAAVVHSEGKISAISFEGWTKTEGDRLCKDLECGHFKSINTTTSDCLCTTKFRCADGKVPENIWDCEKEVYCSQESQSKKQLFIECQGEPKVTLSNTCYGDVKINGIKVCSSHWKESDSHMVCEEQGCSNAIATTLVQPSPNEKYHHVSCEENHYKLGQCKRFMETCSDSLVSVYCVGNAEFKTTEGCGGQIEVKYRGKWEKVCPLKNTFSTTQKERLCKQLVNCVNGNNASIPSQNTDKQVNLETTLSCTNDNQDIKYCLRHQSCEKAKPASIYCDGYVGPPKPTKDSTAPLWPKILGGVFALVLVILIIAFIWICMVKRAKKGQNVLRMSRKEVEIESGDYDDVMSKNEMEELNCGNGATYEVDDQQVSYDDIEVSPEIPETKAEVHDSTRTPPKSDEAAPLVSGQEDEDNLVPRPVSPN